MEAKMRKNYATRVDEILEDKTERGVFARDE
jgi:hypothetical protein